MRSTWNGEDRMTAEQLLETLQALYSGFNWHLGSEQGVELPDEERVAELLRELDRGQGLYADEDVQTCTGGLCLMRTEDGDVQVTFRVDIDFYLGSEEFKKIIDGTWDRDVDDA